MLRKLMETDDDVGMLIVRVFLGLVVFPAGAEKMLGWFGGPGFAASLQQLTSAGLPAALALLFILAQFFGAIGLITGFLGRVCAFGIFVIMVGTVILAHDSFFRKWDGVEYHLLAAGVALAVMVRGSGRLSVDRSLTPDRRIYR